MTAERSLAYGRVMKTLADVGPSKLHPTESDAIRAAADTLLFTSASELDGQALAALEQMGALAERLVESDRWLYDSADRLLQDIEDCGPGLLPSLERMEALAV